ncbi:MAG: hypothetical protein ACJ8FY_25615 [Gemmataceae bacterium]
MFSASLLSLVVAASNPGWHTDYESAYRQAVTDKKDLVIYFREDSRLDEALSIKRMRRRSRDYVFLTIPASYRYDGMRLLDQPALQDMAGQPGLAIVSLHDRSLPTHNQVISAHPFTGSRYAWAPAYGPDEIHLILDLPRRATLTQRSMIYAVSVHPERPRSVYAAAHPAFLGHAERHSIRQASMHNQHHANLIATMGVLSSEMGEGVGGGSEVVAESWGNFVGGETVLEAAFSCVDAWRHSPGHWSAVSGNHRYFGYDIARASNGTWYATGIFAD